MLEQVGSQVLSLFVLTAIFVPLEKLFSVKKQAILRPGLWLDLALFFLSVVVITFFMAPPIGLVAVAARHVIPQGWYELVARLPILVQFVGALFVGEIGFYWSHRAMHASPFLWQFHALHHDPERMDWLVNTRMHPVDLVLSRIVGLALVAIVGFGAPGGDVDPLIPTLLLLFGKLWAFYIHSNINWRMGWIEHIVSTPRFHHWHHSRDDHPHRNFASMLPIFDRLFGTLHMPRDSAWPPTYGIAAEDEPGEQARSSRDDRAKIA